MNTSLEAENVLERVLLEVLSGIGFWHPRQQVLDLLHLSRLGKGTSPNYGQKLCRPIIVRNGDNKEPQRN